MGTSEIVLNTFYVMILLQGYGGQGVECGSFNVTGPHKLIGGSTIRKYGLIGESMSFWGQALRSPMLKLCLGQFTSCCLWINM